MFGVRTKTVSPSPPVAPTFIKTNTELLWCCLPFKFCPGTEISTLYTVFMRRTTQFAWFVMPSLFRHIWLPRPVLERSAQMQRPPRTLCTSIRNLHVQSLRKGTRYILGMLGKEHFHDQVPNIDRVQTSNRTHICMAHFFMRHFFLLTTLC